MNQWICKRKKTVQTLEKVADDIKSRGQLFNVIKYGSAGVAVGSDVVQYPETTYKVYANIAGVLGTCASTLSNIFKAIELSELLKKAQDEISHEGHDYQTVIDELAKFCTDVTDVPGISNIEPPKPNWVKIFAPVCLKMFAHFADKVGNKYPTDKILAEITMEELVKTINIKEVLEVGQEAIRIL